MKENQSKVVSLTTKPQIDDEIKEDSLVYLREMIEMVEKGEVSTVLIVFKRLDKSWGHRRSGVIDFADEIGQLEIVKHHLIQDYLCQDCQRE